MSPIRFGNCSRPIRRPSRTSDWIVIIVLAVAAIALSASSVAAGPDSDLDGVEDAFDNCRFHPNGPAELSNQVDSDSDGYGNACDADYDGDLASGSIDFSFWAGYFSLRYPAVPSAVDLMLDHDGDGAITMGDLAVYLTYYGGVFQGPGPGALQP